MSLTLQKKLEFFFWHFFGRPLSLAGRARTHPSSGPHDSQILYPEITGGDLELSNFNRASETKEKYA
jgi:hypothetical protein